MGAIQDALTLGRGAVGSQGQPDMSNANAVGDEVTQLGNDIGNQEKAAQGPQGAFQEIKYTQNKEGGFDVAVKMPSSTYDYLGNLLQTGMAAEQAFADARQQLRQKRVFQEQNPIIAGIGRIASTAAAQYGSGFQPGRGSDIAPLIRAAGAYGLDQFGQTNAELAQREAGLQAQEFGVANQLYNQQQQDQVLRNAETRQARLDKEATQREQSAAIAEYSRDARSGLIGSEDVPLIQKDLLARGLTKTPEEALAIADSLAKVGEKKKALALAAQAAAEAKQKAQNQFELDKASVVANAQTARLLAGFAHDSDILRKKLEAAGKVADAKAAAKEMAVPATLPDKLANLRSAETSLDLIESKIRKYADYQGVVAGRTIGPAKAYFNRELNNFYTNLKLEVAQTIKSTGAGARGFGPMERGFFERLATAKDHSPQENLGVIDAWRQYIRQNRGAYVDVYPGISQEKYKAVLGKDADLLDAALAAAEQNKPQAAGNASDPLGLK